jgi:hypothetical protein
MAPCYCDDKFIWGTVPVVAVVPGALDAVKSLLRRASLLAASQNWECLGFHAIEPDIPSERVEEVRTCVRGWIDAIRHFDVPAREPLQSRDGALTPERELDNVCEEE